MSTAAVTTGTPTASTDDLLRAREADQVEVVDHQVVHHVDVRAALGEGREAVALDEARLR